MSEYRCGGSYDCKALSMRGLSLAGKGFYIKFRVRTKEGLFSSRSTHKQQKDEDTKTHHRVLVPFFF